MRETLRSLDEIRAAGLLPPEPDAGLAEVAARYAVAVSPTMAALIDPTDPRDPIALQFVPQAAERHVTPGEREDPIGDAVHSPVPGIVHRYPDRVLLTLLHVCPVYCRFCFRRERVGPGPGAVLPPDDTEGALRYIAERPAVWEVILTGGDPLGLSPRRIGAVMERLAAVAHVKVVRFHTRVPVVTPEAVTPDLVAALRSSGKTTYVGLHCNHPRELTPAARTACALLIDAGLALVSQTVLLRGVNDDVETLEALMRAFVELRIRPYYLHHGDLAPGTAHFRVTLEDGRRLVRALRGRVSGLCQPTYVLDIPGGFGKVPVGPDYVGWDGRSVTDPWGVTHDYTG